ncbi:MAG: phosphopentomutase [Oscillospiraceae bacterium]|nr:phosphopentomutase [Oscillospiraceae bacterium]
MKRVFLIVLDSFGIGAEPDAADFGDAGANTLASVCRSPEFSMPGLTALGLGNIDGVTAVPAAARPGAAVARLRERSRGKDTTIGHWELAGVVSPQPLPTYPQGFPPEVLEPFMRATGRGVLCNRPYSGTDVIRDYGQEHLDTGKLIVYTSADSVFQIAAHEALVPPEQLYEYCRQARSILAGPHGVGRVIARPFTGDAAGGFTRTSNRHDFSLEPPGRTLLDAVSEAGQDVIGVGKIWDIFAGRGVTEKILTRGNTDGLAQTLALADRDFRGLCFVNLVDFDMLYGHRQDPDGYARALAEFDRWLPSFTAKLGREDLAFLTADHGCDPSDASTDHTREYVPLIALGPQVRPGNLGTRSTFADLAATAAEALSVRLETEGESFLSAML